MDAKNVPTAVLEFTSANGPLGIWIASGWSGDEAMVSAVRHSYTRQMGQDMANTITGRLAAPQSIEAGGKQYTFTLRPTRVYKTFSLTLLKATHSIYRGTDTSANPDGIPKDFRSRVRIDNPRIGENREVEIYMNSPLRYAGLTFYQFQMAAGEMAQQAGEIPSSTLQVVRNPSWLAPYFGCFIVAAGLIVQFMIHLVGFVGRRKTA